MSVRFDETIRGRKFYEADFPRLIKAIEDHTKELKRSNDLKEIELGVNQNEKADDLHDTRG